MEDTAQHKPSFGEWVRWAKVVADRLTDVVQVYNRPPQGNQAVPDRERQLKVAPILDILRRLHFLADEGFAVAGRPLDEIELKNERSLLDLQGVIADVLRRLPVLSFDMQRLLDSEWEQDCNGQQAALIFCGPAGAPNEGIGSGKPEDGRLPEVLKNLLEQEQQGRARGSDSFAPKDSTIRTEDEAVRRWNKQNSSFLRSAGRVD